MFMQENHVHQFGVVHLDPPMLWCSKLCWWCLNSLLWHRDIFTKISETLNKIFAWGRQPHVLCPRDWWWMCWMWSWWWQRLLSLWCLWPDSQQKFLYWCANSHRQGGSMVITMKPVDPNLHMENIHIIPVQMAVELVLEIVLEIVDVVVLSFSDSRVGMQPCFDAIEIGKSHDCGSARSGRSRSSAGECPDTTRKKKMFFDVLFLQNTCKGEKH